MLPAWNNLQLQERAQLEIEDHEEKGVHQAHRAEMVKMVSQALLVLLVLLAPLVSAGTLLLNMMEKELVLVLDQWA